MFKNDNNQPTLDSQMLSLYICKITNHIHTREERMGRKEKKT